MQCKAKSKQSGEQCKNRCTPGFDVCRIHGGKSLVGASLPQFKTGKHSKYLPEGLLTAYQDAQADSGLLSVRHDITLIDTLILNKLGNLDTGESAAHWDKLLDCISKARKSFHNEDYGGLLQQFDEIEALADKRRLHYATEQEIAAQLEQRRKLVETEQKINLQAERVITSEQAMALVSALLESIKRNVNDATAYTAIQADFIQFVGRQDHRRIEAKTDG